MSESMADRAGVALLETLIAIVILSLAALASVRFVAATFTAQSTLMSRELELRQAEQAVGAVALLTRTELEGMVGGRWNIRGMTIRVDRPQASLYRVGAALDSLPDIEVLATFVHRPGGDPGGEGVEDAP